MSKGISVAFDEAVSIDVEHQRADRHPVLYGLPDRVRAAPPSKTVANGNIHIVEPDRRRLVVVSKPPPDQLSNIVFRRTVDARERDSDLQLPAGDP